MAKQKETIIVTTTYSCKHKRIHEEKNYGQKTYIHVSDVCETCKYYRKKDKKQKELEKRRKK